VYLFSHLPSNGTASDVAGIVSATIFRNTVNDNKIVTPARIMMTSHKRKNNLLCKTIGKCNLVDGVAIERCHRD